MAVESASFISQLSASNPAAGDNISEGDDHLRLIKTVLQTQFPNLGAVAARPTAAQLNKLGFETGSVMMWAAAAAPSTTTFYPVGVGSGFSLGTSTSASADSGTNVLKGIPINFIIKT